MHHNNCINLLIKRHGVCVCVSTFPHHTCELSRDISIRDGCGRGLSITRWRIVGLEALGVLLFAGIGRFIDRCNSRLHLLLGSSGRGINLDWRDDDLLKLLQSIPNVSTFQNILKSTTHSVISGQYKNVKERKSWSLLTNSPFQEILGGSVVLEVSVCSERSYVELPLSHSERNKHDATNKCWESDQVA